MDWPLTVPQLLTEILSVMKLDDAKFDGEVVYGCGLSVEPQTYSSRGDGSAELITGDLVINIDLAHGVTGAQLSMRWMIEHCIYLLCVSSHCALF